MTPRRSAQPEDVAPPIHFFTAESDSGSITGEVLTLLSGETSAAGQAASAVQRAGARLPVAVSS